MSRPLTARTLWLFIAALLLAPALASVWPALGRGPMLYTGEPVAHVGHAQAGDDAHAGHAAQPDHADHAAQPDHADHIQHCALCVLVSLAWAPVVHVATGADAPPAVHRRAVHDTARPRSVLLWSRAHARAPPACS